MSTARETAERDALERWTVGYAREWPSGAVTADQVAHAGGSAILTRRPAPAAVLPRSPYRGRGVT